MRRLNWYVAISNFLKAQMCFVYNRNVNIGRIEEEGWKMFET